MSGRGTRFDAASQLTLLSSSGAAGVIVNRFTYSYDNARNRTRALESNGDRTTWSYDRTYQLTRERRGGLNSYDVTYTYDPTGKRLVQTASGTRTTSAYDAANQLFTEITAVVVQRILYAHLFTD